MTGSKSVVMKNQPEIIIIPVEAILGKSSCEFSKPAFLKKQFARNNLSDGRKKAEAARNNLSDHNKQHEVIAYADDKTLSAIDNLKEKLSTMGYCRKRGPPDLGNVRKKKREKLISWLVPERLDEKQELRKQLSEVARGNVSQCMQRFLEEFGINCWKKEGKIKLDKDTAVDQEILPKLKDKVSFKRAGERLEKQRHESEKKREQQRKEEREAKRKQQRKEEREAKRKQQREEEREAARLALQQIGKTVEFDDNMQTLKDFFMLIGCPLSKQYGSFEGPRHRSHLWNEFEEGEIRE